MGKYENYVKPKFKYIEESLKKGATEEEIAKHLGVSYASFRSYKKTHPELNGLIVSAKQDADLPVISALYEAAVGGKILIESREVKDANGNVERVKTSKVMPPNIDAAKFWLTNRRPEEFKNKQDVKAEAEIIEKLEEFV